MEVIYDLINPVSHELVERDVLRGMTFNGGPKMLQSTFKHMLESTVSVKCTPVFVFRYWFSFM